MRPDIVNDDLCFFCPFPGRLVPESKKVVGNFVNLLPVLVEAPRDADILATVHAVRDGVLWTMLHQSLPFDQVMAEVGDVDATGEQLPRKRRSLFIGGNPVEELELGGIIAQPRAPALRTAMFDVSLWIADTGTQLRTSLVHRRVYATRRQAQAWLAALEKPLADG